MSVLYFIVPLALLIAGSAVAAFVWSVRSGQLDDVDTPPRRMLLEDQIVDEKRGASAVTGRA
jgi:cbb3-type cytochrome oxidase maturation protein